MSNKNEKEPLLIRQLRAVASGDLQPNAAAGICQQAVVALVNLDDMLNRERQHNAELQARLNAINVAATNYTPDWPEFLVIKAKQARQVLNKISV